METIVAIDGGLWQAYADQYQLETAVLNLVINARDAMEGRGKVTVAASNAEVGGNAPPPVKDMAPGQYVTICVADTGGGMAPEVLAKAFDPFFTTKPTGTGLGLSQVYGFVRQSGGHIQIDSEPEKAAAPPCASICPATAAAPPPHRKTRTPQPRSRTRSRARPSWWWKTRPPCAPSRWKACRNWATPSSKPTAPTPPWPRATPTPK